MGRQMWFGTEGRMRWVPVPQSGATASAQSSGTSGTLLGGGGFARHAFSSHKNYAYQWSNASSIEAAAIMMGYRSGTYGRGLIHFHEPTHYRTNLLPAHWADPSLGLNWEAPAIRRTPSGPSAVPTAGFVQNDLPVTSARYDLRDVTIGYPGETDSLLIPIPPGFTLLLGAIHTVTGTGGIFASPYIEGAGYSSPQRLTRVAANASVIAPDQFTGIPGVRLWLGKTTTAAATVTATALVARLVPILTLNRLAGAGSGSGYGFDPYGQERYGGTPDGTATLPIFHGPWIAGQGHSGARFVDVPTLTNHSGVAGGQVGYAAQFKEVGAWVR